MDQWSYRWEFVLEQEVHSVFGSQVDPALVELSIIPAPDGHDDEVHHGEAQNDEHKSHDDVMKVKNIDSIVLGGYEMETWYFSPFPLNTLVSPRCISVSFVCLSLDMPSSWRDMSRNARFDILLASNSIVLWRRML